jgi:hypothetical protein
MLLDPQRQLLTAFVDGELNSRQRRHVARLLRRSDEARQLLRQLRADAAALRRLPPPHVLSDLTDEILRTIKERSLTPGKGRLAKASTTSLWIGPLGAWATAAAVLLTLGVASYLYFASSRGRPVKPDVAQKQPEPTPPPNVVPDQPKSVAVAQGKSAPTPADPKALKNPENAPGARPFMKRSNGAPMRATPGKSAEPPKDDSVLTDRLEMFQYSKVETVLPVVLKVRELEQESVRNKLISELGKDVNFRLELPCQNGTRAFERVQPAAKAMNFALVIEKQAQERLKLPAKKTNYVVYIENITPEELARLVRQIGAEDEKVAGGKAADHQIDRLVLTRMTAQHHKELATLIGIDPTESAPNPKGPLDADVHKPLSDLTAQQVGKALAGQGGAPRPEAGKPPQFLALVLAYNPVRPHPGSAEIKRFLESRKPAKPGTIRVLLVLRS